MKWLPVDCHPGDMIRINIGSVYHYGVFCSEEEVIEFGEAPEGSLFRDFETIKVMSVDIDRFANGKIVEVAQLDKKERRSRFPAEKTVEIARSMIGEGGYDLLHNNCEHFANYCLFGIKRCSKEEEARLRWKNRSFFDIYIAKIPTDLKIEKVYPKIRQKEISSAKNEKVRAEKFFVWKLLGFALKESLNTDIKDLDFKKEPDGKWVCDKCCFSLSHTKGFAAVAVSDKPVGVDIENFADFKSRTDPETLKKLSLRANIPIDTGETGYEDFLAGWTKKESIFKCFGEKISEQTDLTSYSAETFRSGDCIVSYCGENAHISIVWRWDGSDSRSMITPDILEKGKVEA